MVFESWEIMVEMINVLSDFFVSPKQTRTLFRFQPDCPCPGYKVEKQHKFFIEFKSEIAGLFNARTQHCLNILKRNKRGLDMLLECIQTSLYPIISHERQHSIIPAVIN